MIELLAVAVLLLFVVPAVLYGISSVINIIFNKRTRK